MWRERFLPNLIDLSVYCTNIKCFTKGKNKYYHNIISHKILQLLICKSNTVVNVIPSIPK